MQGFDAADQYSSQMGSGVDPANDALMQSLAQIKQIQEQPLLAQDPMSQISRLLQGISAGYRGQPNPAIQQAIQMRQAQIAPLQQDFQNQMGLANMGLRSKNEERLAQQFRTEKTISIAKDLMSSADPSQNALGAQFFAQGVKDATGQIIAPDALKDIGQKPFAPGEANAIKSQLIGGFPPDVVASMFKRPLATIQSIQAIKDTPELRAAIKMESDAKIQKDITDEAAANLDFLTKSRNFLHPWITKEVLAQAKIQYPTKRLEDLPDAVQSKLVADAENKSIMDRRGIIDYQAEKNLDKPVPIPQRPLFVTPGYPYQTPNTAITQRNVEGNGLVQLPDIGTRRTLGGVITLGKTIQKQMDMVLERPNFWPPTVKDANGNAQTMANQIAVGQGWAAMKARGGVDPVLAQIEAMKADLVRMATTAGSGSRMSNLLIQLERDSAGWGQAGTREYKITQFQTSMSRINAMLESLGLEPLPQFVTRPDGTQVRVPTGGR